MSVRKTTTVTETVHSEMGEDGTWQPLSRTVVTTTESVEYDQDGYAWTLPQRRPFPYSPRFGEYRDFSDRLAQRVNPRKDTDVK